MAFAFGCMYKKLSLTVSVLAWSPVRNKDTHTVRSGDPRVWFMNSSTVFHFSVSPTQLAYIHVLEYCNGINTDLRVLATRQRHSTFTIQYLKARCVPSITYNSVSPHAAG